jgi:hypothetical protein
VKKSVSANHSFYTLPGYSTTYQGCDIARPIMKKSLGRNDLQDQIENLASSIDDFIRQGQSLGKEGSVQEISGLQHAEMNRQSREQSTTASRGQRLLGQALQSMINSSLNFTRESL